MTRDEFMSAWGYVEGTDATRDLDALLLATAERADNLKHLLTPPQILTIEDRSIAVVEEWFGANPTAGQVQDGIALSLIIERAMVAVLEQDRTECARGVGDAMPVIVRTARELEREICARYVESRGFDEMAAAVRARGDVG